MATIPEELDVLAVAGNAVIRRRWLTAKIIPLIFIAILWNGFLVFFYWGLLGKAKAPTVVALLPLLHVGVGVLLAYFVIASLFNQTDVTISGSSVRVAHRPVPWPGNKAVPTSEITGVLVRIRPGNRGAPSYAVMYADRARHERTLLAGLPQSEQADFIAQTIRERLKLTPVGEGSTR